MRRTLEAIFRHPLQLLILILLLPIIGVGVEYLLVPRSYQAQASLWALQRYTVIGASGPESDTLATPAATQATALTELLQTHFFVRLVVKGIDLAPTLNLGATITNDPQQLDDALYTEISKHVIVAPQAYNLLEISYTNTNPQVAKQIVASVISYFGAQSQGLAIAEGQNLLASYQTQLADAQKNANTALAAETEYIRAHPASKVVSDPQLASLDTNRVQAQTAVQNIQNTISGIQQSISTQGTNVNNLFQVVDAPQIPNRPVTRSKYYLIGGGVGIGIALLACILYIVILVRRDQAIQAPSDLQEFVALPVVIEIPTLSPVAISMLTSGDANTRALLN